MVGFSSGVGGRKREDGESEERVGREGFSAFDGSSSTATN